ncbi:MAG: putative Ig domain-containing protein, partial [Runella sp.]
NMPPIVRFKIPNQALFVTQKFSYKIPDSLFFDTNGYIERIETPNLPAWLTFRNNQISGTATLPGKYTVTLKAIDDDEAATTTSFEIEVRYANIRFELIQAGKAGSRRLLSELKNGDVLLESNLPASVTIYAHCELPAQRLDFRLSGPYQKQITVSRFPFALFDEETGFVPIAGSYTLEAIAYNDSLAVSATKINFNVKTSQPLGDWQAYPNPFDGVCNVKLPDATDETSLSYRLVLPTGQAISISLSNVTIVEKVAYFNFSTMSLPTGTLFLEIYQQQQLQKILKIVKQ